MILRVFARRTNMTPIDDYVFIGDPQFSDFIPPADEVHISVSFTWDMKESRRLVEAWKQYYPVVKIGGAALNDHGDGFTPGLYIKSGVVITSRGCNNQCPWCEVWKREGKIRELPIYAGSCNQDSNLFQCSKGHIRKVFSMLKHQHHIQLASVDARLLTDEWADDIRSLNIHQVFFAADTRASIRYLKKAVVKVGLPMGKVRCYVLLKYNPKETISDAEARLREVWEAGAIPFAQLYQPPADKKIEYPSEWLTLQRNWSRPAIIKSIMDNQRAKIWVG